MIQSAELRMVLLRPIHRRNTPVCNWQDCTMSGENAFDVEWALGIQAEKNAILYLCDEHVRSYTIRLSKNS